MSRRFIILASLFLALLLVSESALGQGRHDAKVQFVTAGVSFQPGWIQSNAPGEDSTSSYAQATTIRLGYQHRVAPAFFMSAELDLGAQYVRSHSATLDARPTPSETALAWQIGMLGRWVSGESGVAPTAGVGLFLFNAGLESASLQILSADIRSGLYIWQNEDFAMIELGYSIPFIAGLNRPTEFSADQDPQVPETWTFHRFSLSFSYGW